VKPCSRRGLGVLGSVLLLAPLAGAEVRQIEAVGATPLHAGTSPATAPRDAAVHRALEEAVLRVASDLVPAMDPEEAAAYLPEALGSEPLDYTARYRITEDRGESPAAEYLDTDASLVYVVVVEAHIDASRVAERLERAGLLFAGDGSEPLRNVRLVIEDLQDYAAYTALRNVLVDGAGAESALPVEMARGRSELLVATSQSPDQLLESLLQSAPPQLRITPLVVARDGISLRVALEAPPEVEDPAAASAGAADRHD
jgi:hypothetical protein